jgi:hypothetical protein
MNKGRASGSFYARLFLQSDLWPCFRAGAGCESNIVQILVDFCG